MITNVTIIYTLGFIEVKLGLKKEKKLEVKVEK
jgi:hypothetical protein